LGFVEKIAKSTSFLFSVLAGPMTSYVDVDRSEEALQEDEELIEAVEQIVAKSAEAIITDVKNDVSGFYETLKRRFDRMFPFVEYWTADHALFWLDMQHLAISGILFAIFFLFLTPWQQKSTRRHGESNDKYKGKNTLRRQSSSYDRLLQFAFGNLKSLRYRLQRTSLQNTLERSKSTSSIVHAALNSSGSSAIYQVNNIRREMEEVEEDETEMENFAKRWPAILETPYRNLVLPPDCKRVEKPKKLSITKGSLRASKVSAVDQEGSTAAPPNRRKQNSRRSKRSKISSDDHPWDRLVNYVKHLFHLIMLFRRYDYAGAGWMLIHWFQAAIRARTRKHQPEPEDDDDDEDEYSVASSSILSTSMDHDDSGGRISSSTHSSERHKRDPTGNTTPVAGNRSKVSPRTVRSKKEKVTNTIQEAPAMPGIRDQGSQNNNGRTEISGNFGNNQYVLNGKPGRAEENPKNDQNSCSNADLTSIIDSDGSFDRRYAASIVEAEEKKEMSSYANETLTQTPPFCPQVRGSETPQYLTPIRESQVPVLHMSSPPKTTPVSLSSTPTSSTPSKPSLLHGHSNKPASTLNVTKTRDALQSYRKGGTRTWTGQFHPLPVSVTSSDQPTTSLNKLSIDRLDSGRKSYYFETVETNENLKRMVVEIPVPDRNGYFVGDEFLPDNNFTPLLAFVNSRSGPQQGHLLITQLRGLLNPIQVWDLADGGPEEVLESFSAFTRLRILVCGGDGTVSWIVSTIEKMNLQRWPPIAILPLGTGNDLARIHGWGGGYNNESLINILEQVSEGYISWLDRWEMTVENKKGEVKQVKSFFNYLGVGADAQAALQVHMLRESRPQLFFSRLVNKAWYGVFGAEDIIKATSINLPHDITLLADGVEVPLPADSQGIILLNIDSYAGGVSLWASGHKAEIPDMGGFQPMKRSMSLDALRTVNRCQGIAMSTTETRHTPLTPSPPKNLERIDSVEDIASLVLTDEEKYTRVTACNRPSSCQDGLLDIVSIRGAFHLGQIRVGLSTAQKLCQCREATIMIKRKVSVQIDGEPWRQNVCTLKVRKKKDSAIMLHCPGNESNGVETEMAKLLDWAEDRNLIDKKVHGALMKEFSRRIESKTRQRRTKEHPLLTLKRAMKSGNSSKTFHDHKSHNHLFHGRSGIRGQVGSPSGDIFF
jgi:diacylglycerol kinase (ATP)